MIFEKHVQPLFAWFKHVITEPRDELGRWQRAVRFSYELGIYGWKALRKDNATQMAAALAFRTLFALLPVLVVSAVFVKGVRGKDEFKHLALTVAHAIGLDALRVNDKTSDAGPPPQSMPASASQPAATSPDVASVDAGPSDLSHAQSIEDIIDQISDTDLSALGWIGMLLVIYSAISLMVTIENSFNAVYGAPHGRAWVWRVLIYWAVLTLGPAFIGLTVYVDGRFAEFISGVHTWKWLLNVAKFAWGFSVAWLLMFSVYRLLPNTKVTSRAAMIGGFVAAFLLQTGKSSFSAYFMSGWSMQSLAGALGLVPILMFWTYLMWLVVLFGLEVSATIQLLQGRGFEEIEEKKVQNGIVDPAMVLGVMEIISARFAQGQATLPRQITDETHVPEDIVCKITDRLAQAGLLHRVDRLDETDPAAVTLARPPEQISAQALIDIGFSLVDEGGTGRPSALLQRLREAQLRLAQNDTLASLLAAGGLGGSDGRQAPTSA